MLMRLYKLVEVAFLGCFFFFFFFLRGKREERVLWRTSELSKPLSSVELRLQTSIKECSLIPTELMLRHEAKRLNLFFTFLIFSICPE